MLVGDSEPAPVSEVRPVLASDSEVAAISEAAPVNETAPISETVTVVSETAPAAVSELETEPAPLSHVMPALPDEAELAVASAAQNDVQSTQPVISFAATPIEQDFFAAAAEFPVAELELEVEAEKPLLLRPEQLQRRLWFRRQVTRLMAGLGAFSLVTTAIRIASSI